LEKDKLQNTKFNLSYRRRQLMMHKEISRQNAPGVNDLVVSHLEGLKRKHNQR